jgi:hypothetical protein
MRPQLNASTSGRHGAGVCALNTRYDQTVILVASSLLASSCNRIGEPPRWWYSNHIDKSLWGPARYPTPPRQAGATGRRAPAAVREHYARLRSCYDALLKTNNEARGKFKFASQVAPNGRVTTRCMDGETTVDDQGLARAALAGELLASLDGETVDEGREAAWAEKLRSRLDAWQR